MTNSDMTNSKMNQSCETFAPGPGVLPLLRGWAGSRMGLLTIGAAAIVAGLSFNWSWLVAAGVAPLIVGVLPCVVMCALGLCMMGMGDRSSGKRASPGGASPLARESGTAVRTPALVEGSRMRNTKGPAG